MNCLNGFKSIPRDNGEKIKKKETAILEKNVVVWELLKLSNILIHTVTEIQRNFKQYICERKFRILLE